jgi:hypothetical protein
MSTRDTDTGGRFKAIYLGSEPMGELLEGENGSDAIQVPLRRIILRTNFSGKEASLSVTNNSLTFEYVKHQFRDADSLVTLPIELLAYCGALRQLPHDKVIAREFETLDKAPMNEAEEEEASSGATRYMPPLFVTIFRSIESENMLFCHAFVLAQDDDAMELVKLVMEVYYGLVKMGEEEEEADESNEHEASADLDNDEENANTSSMKKSSSSVKLNEDSSANTYLKELLSAYNNIALGGGGHPTTRDNSDGKSVISAREIMSGDLDSNKYTIVKSSSSRVDMTNTQEDGEVECINQDPNPIVIKKQNNEEVVYKQNVYIRWLQPPTPPPPAPIISNNFYSKMYFYGLKPEKRRRKVKNLRKFLILFGNFDEKGKFINYFVIFTP